jgi:hypothetical protein
LVRVWVPCQASQTPCHSPAQALTAQAVPVSDMTAMHLLQFPGVTADKAKALVMRYPTVSR